MWERYGGEGLADGAVTMLLPCCWGAAARREVAERNLHGAVSMLFATVGVGGYRPWGSGIDPNQYCKKKY